MRGCIVIAGAMAQKPRQGGFAWFFLQFLLGFRSLGWDVLFLDRLQANMCTDACGRPARFEESSNLEYFLGVMRRFGLEGSFSLDYNRGEEVVGLPRQEVLRRVAGAPFLLNVMGYLDDDTVLAQARQRVFLDIDPGFPQMWRDLGLHDAFAGHDRFVTLGRNIGRPGCAIPDCGLAWIALAQPIVLAQWLAESAPADLDADRGAFTSIGAWRGPNGPITYRGRTYGLRVHEFRKFIGLPALCPDSWFQMALEIHPGDASDIRSLRDNGWSLVEPQAVAGSPDDFRAYIVRSKAEFMVPKQMYVDTNSGLLSDRSVCYLATGRPVLARDTGIGSLYPTGEGLLSFSTLDEARAGVESINGNYQRHAKAAREIAVEYFDSAKVLSGLLADLGAG